MKNLLFALLTVAFIGLLFAPSADAQNNFSVGNVYVRTPVPASPPYNAPAGWWYAIGKASYTFIGRTDTVLFLFNPSRPSLYYLDTLIANVNTTLTTTDSSNVTYELWNCSDTTGWWNSTKNCLDPSIWTIKTAIIARDSSATATITLHQFQWARSMSTASGTEWAPYMAFAVIAKAALSNGKANKLGSVIKADIIKP